MPEEQPSPNDLDWKRIRAQALANEAPPPEWPEDVAPISISGVNLLGIHRKTGDLYWDGHRVETTFRFGAKERLFAIIVTFATASMAVVDLLRFAYGE